MLKIWNWAYGYHLSLGHAAGAGRGISWLGESTDYRGLCNICRYFVWTVWRSCKILDNHERTEYFHLYGLDGRTSSTGKNRSAEAVLSGKSSCECCTCTECFGIEETFSSCDGGRKLCVFSMLCDWLPSGKCDGKRRLWWFTQLLVAGYLWLWPLSKECYEISEVYWLRTGYYRGWNAGYPSGCVFDWFYGCQLLSDSGCRV